MSSLVRDWITDALFELGYLDAGSTVEGEDALKALRYAQGLVDLQQADPLMLWTVQRVSFVLPANQQAVTIGPAGTGAALVGQRPLWIRRPTITPAGDTSELDLLPYTRNEWLDEPIKSLQDLFPRRVLYEPSGNLVGTFTFWPIQTSTPTFAYGLPVALTAPLTLDTDLAWPPGGYQVAYRLLLARQLARPFRRPVTQDLVDDCNDALGAIRRLNDEGPPIGGVDPALTSQGVWDIFSNRYR